MNSSSQDSLGCCFLDVSMIFRFVQSHVLPPGATTMWTRLVGTIRLRYVPQISPMLPPESKRVYFCFSVSTLRAQSLPLIEQSEICKPVCFFNSATDFFMYFLLVARNITNQSKKDGTGFIGCVAFDVSIQMSFLRLLELFFGAKARTRNRSCNVR